MSDSLDLHCPAIRAHYVEILGQLLEEEGGRRDAVFAAVGLAADRLLHPDTLLTVAEFVAVCREALKQSRDPALGLAFGQRLKFTTHGSLSQAAISCATIEEALRTLAKYFSIRFAYIDLTFFVEGGDAVIQLDMRHDFDDLYRFNVEAVLAALMDVNQLLFGKRLMLDGSCRLAYPAPEPSHRARYAALFGESAHFGQPANQLRFRADLLALPMALHNPVARRLAEAECEVELARLARHQGVAGRVRSVLESVTRDPLPGLDAVADQLHVSPRTLRRQLKREGTGFQALLDEVRAMRARWLLTRTSQSVEVIAWQLGYSDPSNFGRAFRKWERCSPSAYRAEHRGQGASA
ncbi:AraC family transcriptional regulator [Marinobacter halodurans]|uniref:AraC family transcriptional regulator n=1 Tax=Marinobacter halodurans TaxID=2528979 RepID=A0ABY1ZL57_9GAMM|nr:AraC family transcriptional regulator [Marinobacter halodurans]TBW52182.1 AraC family transcriptional regulator [Marinobacter halodurans]